MASDTEGHLERLRDGVARLLDDRVLQLALRARPAGGARLAHADLAVVVLRVGAAVGCHEVTRLSSLPRATARQAHRVGIGRVGPVERVQRVVPLVAAVVEVVLNLVAVVATVVPGPRCVHARGGGAAARRDVVGELPGALGGVIPNERTDVDLVPPLLRRPPPALALRSVGATHDGGGVGPHGGDALPRRRSLGARGRVKRHVAEIEGWLRATQGRPARQLTPDTPHVYDVAVRVRQLAPVGVHAAAEANAHLVRGRHVVGVRGHRRRRDRRRHRWRRRRRRSRGQGRRLRHYGDRGRGREDECALRSLGVVRHRGRSISVRPVSW